MKKTYSKTDKNSNNIIMIPYKSLSENDINQKLIKFNGFNIIELTEDEKNIDLNEEITLNELENDLESFSQKERTRLINISNKVENYFLNKEGHNNIEDGTCFKCRIKFLNSKDLLYFLNKKELLSYLKYCFYFLKKIIFVNHQNYSNNKYDLLKCDSNYLIGWKFSIPKAMCKICFMEVINMNNLFGNLKTIFCDIDKIDLDKHKSKSYSNHFRRNHRRSKKRILSLKINSNDNLQKIKNNKSNYNKNIIINNEKNIIIIQKSILKDLDLSLLNKTQIENQKIIDANNNNLNLKEKKIVQTFNTYNIINHYQINNQYNPNNFGLINNNFEKEQNINLKEERIIPQFISNKYYIFFAKFMNEMLSEIKNINNNLVKLKIIELNSNGCISEENYNKFKSYFNRTFVNINKYSICTYNILKLIDRENQKIINFINELLNKEMRNDMKNILNDLIQYLIIIKNERNNYVNIYKNMIEKFSFYSKIFQTIFNSKEFYIKYYNNNKSIIPYP